MGKTMMGSTSQVGLKSPEQEQFINQAMQGGGAFGQFLNPQNYDEMFQKSVVDPAMKAHQQQVIPGLQQRFVDAGAGSSSALNQALSQSATDLSSSLGQKYMDFFTGQQDRTLSALGQQGQLAGQQMFQPVQQGGIAGDLLGAAGQMLGGGGGAGALMSMIQKLFGGGGQQFGGKQFTSPGVQV